MCVLEFSREPIECTCVFVYKEICYVQLAPAIMEAGQSQDLQSELVNWKPRRANGLVLDLVQKPEKQERGGAISV